MFRQVRVAVVLACSALLPAGCGARDGTRASATSATWAGVTVHVAGMAERLGLT
jgi:hypothetical protein